ARSVDGGGGVSRGVVGGGAAASSSSSSSSSLPGIVSALAGLTGVTAPFGCTEEWLCTAWTNCTIEGLQQRDCEDQNFCGTQNSKPHEVQSCEYTPTCFDEILNGEETDVDCGGSKCEVCPGCNNGIKDPDEEGVDCGGSCRPCDSCYDGEQNYGESGVDCGGPCPACTEAGVAILEYPKILCEKPLNPLRNDAKWFLLLVLILLLARVYLYKKELKWIKEDQLLDEFKRARYYADRRREMWLFILVTIVVTLLSYLYYYEFLLCAIGYKYLWAFLLVLVLVPIVVYYLLRAITYSDTRKLARLQAEEKTHETVLHELMIFENNQIMEIEQDIAHMIEGVGTNVALVTELQKFPELKAIYQDIVRLHDEYHTSKTPTGIEKDLCDQVYAIETNEHFERLADEYPEITVIYQKLALLYHHYEAKQQLYDELASLKKQTREKFSDEVKPPAVEGDDDPDLDDQFSGDPEEDS
ncbi:MAG: hypothetical protein OXR66_05105, partial [Candidatus Woesearchaeota archaeon]|nr:hypothetical protein [Candidatus Woesearchaeota archaeon]